MKNAHNILLLSLLLAMLTFTACTGLREVRPTSCRVESIAPQGFHSIGMKIALGVRNPSVQFTVKDVQAVLHHKSGDVAEVTASPFTVLKKSDQVYPVDLQISLSKGFGLKNILGLLQDPENMDNFTVDVSAKVKLKGGAAKRFRYEDIPLEKFMKMIRL